MATLWHKTPCSVDQILTIMVDLSLPGIRQEDFERNNAFSIHDLLEHVLAQETLHQGS